jgi:predicted nucleic acid-binding protein
MRDVRVFIDTNTFIYSNDMLDEAKRSSARSWLGALTVTNAGVTNLQVLNETTNVLIKKAQRFESGDPFEKVDIFADFGSTPLDGQTVTVAREIHLRSRYSWWDCLLLASAINLGCTHFLSEDLNDGQTIQGLTIVDPFAHSPDQILFSR